MKSAWIRSGAVLLATVLAVSTTAAQYPSYWFTGTEQGEELGWKVTSTPDVNADSISDIIMSAYEYDNGRGRVLVISGQPPFETHFVFKGENAGDLFGSAISAGDVNGDGLADVLVTAPRHYSNRGRAYVFLGHSHSGPADTISAATASLIITGQSAGLGLGGEATIAGDINGDQYADMIVNGNGMAGVYFGEALTSQVLKLSGDANRQHSQMGWAIAAVGDLTGNGRNEYVLTYYLYSGYGADSSQIGRAYLFSDSGVVLKVFTGETADDYFGWSVGSAGDVDRDGVPDVVIGANTYDTLNLSPGFGRGKVYVYSGGHVKSCVNWFFKQRPFRSDWSSISPSLVRL